MWFRGKADEPKEAAPSRPPLREEKKLQRRQKLTNRVTNTLPIEGEGRGEGPNLSLSRHEGFTKGCRRVRGRKVCTNLIRSEKWTFSSTESKVKNQFYSVSSVHSVLNISTARQVSNQKAHLHDNLKPNNLNKLSTCETWILLIVSVFHNDSMKAVLTLRFHSACGWNANSKLLCKPFASFSFVQPAQRLIYSNLLLYFI